MYEFQVGEDEQSAVEEVKGNKMRECKRVLFCPLPTPAVPGVVATWVTYLGSEGKELSKHLPSILSEILEGGGLT